MTVDQYRRHRGPRTLSLAEKRVHTVSTRLNVHELARLDAARLPVRMQRGEYLRNAALDVLPKPIPEVNRDAWSILARAAANLNQLTREANRGRYDVEAIREILSDFRRALIGAAK